MVTCEDWVLCETKTQHRLLQACGALRFGKLYYSIGSQRGRIASVTGVKGLAWLF